MLNRRQWQWCADNYQLIRRSSIALVFAFFAYYAYTIYDRWWGAGKIPIRYAPSPSAMEALHCSTEEVNAMFIPPLPKPGSSGLVRPTDPGPYADSRFFLLEFHPSKTVGAEMLEKRPECFGALVADLRGFPGPIAVSVIDRTTGNRIFRLAKIDPQLSR